MANSPRVQPRGDAPPSVDALEPLTEEQRAVVRQWQQGGKVDSPEVAALRKRARGEPLTPVEAALIAPTPETRARIAAMGPSVPHAQVMAELAARPHRGG